MISNAVWKWPPTTLWFRGQVSGVRCPGRCTPVYTALELAGQTSPVRTVAVRAIKRPGWLGSMVCDGGRGADEDGSRRRVGVIPLPSPRHIRPVMMRPRRCQIMDLVLDLSKASTEKILPGSKSWWRRIFLWELRNVSHSEKRSSNSPAISYACATADRNKHSFCVFALVSAPMQ
ncbi:hypothetical protein RRG08_062032 [Elysia crispata]|uniref:Uncharacterized protein n=1 Tax=Elysia crispata TaxID=231223 RepID=A0AAE1A4A2_9GAST|nr:hypothetical protein RRG08_062032 [Elysia crispata]